MQPWLYKVKLPYQYKIKHISKETCYHDIRNSDVQYSVENKQLKENKETQNLMINLWYAI